jgi:heavy metal sensor kinase
MTRRIPIRWRLSVLYTALTIVVLAIFSGAVYAGMQRQLSNQLDEDLKSQAALAAQTIDRSTFETTYEFTDEALLRVIGFDGTVLVSRSARNLSDFSLSPPRSSDITSAQSGESNLTTLTYQGIKLRIITVPVLNSDGSIVAVLQLGYSTARINDPLNVLVKALFVIAPVAILAAAALGYMLAGRALQPVSRIASLASQIDGDDLHERLNLDLPNDELGQLARTFDSMLGRIELAFQRQKQFTGDAAHELRTPLALMRSQIDLAISQGDSPEDYREALNALDGDVGRMTALVGTLLSLARADAGELQVNRDQLDLSGLAEDVVEQLTPIAEENGVTLSTRLSPTSVQADADMVIQVLVNLIDNAIKNTPPGGTITIETWVEQNNAMLAVRDTGIGIPPQHLDRIFDRFYRVDTGRARSRGGSGLGLAICQSIAHAHGGEISATSAPGAGSSFTLSLPGGTSTAVRTAQIPLRITPPVRSTSIRAKR